MNALSQNYMFPFIAFQHNNSCGRDPLCWFDFYDNTDMYNDLKN